MVYCYELLDVIWSVLCLLKEKLKEKEKSHIPFRLNLLFLIVFFSFIALISRLAYIQLVKGDEFVALSLQRTETTTAKNQFRVGRFTIAKDVF